MLRAVIICPDQELGDRLQAGLLETHRVGIVRRLDRYPNMVDLVRFLRAAAPQLVFLGVETRQEALAVTERILAHAPGTQMVAINRTCDPPTLLATMQAGIREFLCPPFEQEALQKVLVRSLEALQQKPQTFDSTDSVFAFLPSKPGVGTSTIAVNTSVALARIPDNNVLLVDLDLNCGMVGFMLQIESQYSVVDAAENALEMDENLWPKLVTSIGNLDVLPAGKLNPGFRIEGAQIRNLMDFARRNYKAVCVDLSGLMEKYSIEILQEAKRVFLVCTPEIPSVHLARERINFLRGLELESRITILLNRSQKRHELSLSEMEKLFGLPIHTTFPNDYHGVHKSLTAGKPIDTHSILGQRFESLAKSLVPKTAPLVKEKRNLFDMWGSRKKSSISSVENQAKVLTS